MKRIGKNYHRAIKKAIDDRDFFCEKGQSAGTVLCVTTEPIIHLRFAQRMTIPTEFTVDRTCFFAIRNPFVTH